MTSCPYESPITSFDHGIKPEPWYTVDVLKEGRNALEKINEELGNVGKLSIFLSEAISVLYYNTSPYLS